MLRCSGQQNMDGQDDMLSCTNGGASLLAYLFYRPFDL